MAWTSPRTWVTSEIVTASIMNTHVRDNLLQTGPAKVTNAGDFLYGSAANVLTAIAASGNARKVPRWNAGETALEAWDPNLWNLFDNLYNYQLVARGHAFYTAAAAIGTPADAALAGGGMAYRVQAGATITPNTNGTALLSTGATSGTDVGFVGPPTQASMMPACACIISSMAGAASQTIIIGFVTSNADIATDANNMIGIRIAATGNVFAVVDNGGTETTRDSGSGSAATVAVDVQSTSLVRIYRNGVQIGADITTNIPTSALVAVCGISTQTTANKTISIGGFAAVATRNGG